MPASTRKRGYHTVKDAPAAGEQAIERLRTRAACARVGLLRRLILDCVWIAEALERGSSKSSKLRKGVSNVRAWEIAKAVEEYQHRRWRPRRFDPFSWLERLIDKGLLTLERAVRRLVKAVVR